jgi:hypothetical protein
MMPTAEVGPRCYYAFLSRVIPALNLLLVILEELLILIMASIVYL